MASTLNDSAASWWVEGDDRSTQENIKGGATVPVPRWYVIQCKARQEARALEHLERQHYQCFLPRRRVKRVVQGQWRGALEPLFPGYLFIHLDNVNDNWTPIRSTRGVLCIVRFKEYPEAIADELIAGIRQRLVESTDTKPYFNCGDRVLITEGAFSQIESIFAANDGHERVRLLMQMLGDQHEVSVPLSIVRKV